MSYTIKEKYSIAKSAAKGALIVPLLGLGAHLFMETGSALFGGHGGLHDDHTLKNRFETAYCFNTPDEHKYYHFDRVCYDSLTDLENDEDWTIDTERNRYMATPWATYPAMLALGLYCARRRKQQIKSR